MGKRVCRLPGCPALVDAAAYRGLCDEHRKQHDRERGDREARGYGRDHIAERVAIQHRIDAGHPVTCWRCGVRLTGRAWHLDHASDRTTYRGPACTPCNLHLAGKASHGADPPRG